MNARAPRFSSICPAHSLRSKSSSAPFTRRPSLRVAVALAAFGCAFACAASATAAEKTGEKSATEPNQGTPAAPESGSNTAGDGRVVGGHALVTPNSVVSASVNSSFRFAQGFGLATFDFASVLDGQQTTGKLFLYGQQIVAQFGISNRFSLDLKTEGSAAVGGDLESIVGIGALANVTAGALPKVRLFTLDDVGLQATAGVGLFYSKSITLKPSAFIGKATGELQGSEGNLVQQSNSVDVTPTLALAEGIGPLGLQASFTTRIPASGREGGLGIDAGLHATLAFSKLSSSVPLAITGEAVLSHDASTSGYFAGGFYYSGRKEFDLGVVFGAKTGGVDLKQGQMVMQYYF